MSIQDLGSIGELVAAIATVVTLVYLAIQIRANTRALRSESRRHEQQASNPFLMAIVENEDVARLFVAALSDPDSLSPEDSVRFSLLLGQHVGAAAQHYDEILLGSASRSTLARRSRSIGVFLNTRGGRRFWSQYADQYPDEFREYVEKEVLRRSTVA